uniref:Uncharacterized protein n=1 Tax=Bionectria ochroleuca TaxID=29856 RepID=A0A8H7N7T4_BIOOC
MKLTLGLVAALAGCAAAAQQAAEVYILPGASQSSTVPSVSRSLARLILLQRLAPAGKGPSTAEIPNGSDAENVVSLISKFGKEPVSLFGQGETLAPSQLVVMLEGLNDDQIKTLGRSFKSGPSFTIPDPPSAHANEKLISNDVYNVGVTNDHKCSIKKLSNPFDKNCWSGKSAVAKYNVQKDPSVIGDLSRLAPISLALLRAARWKPPSSSFTRRLPTQTSTNGLRSPKNCAAARLLKKSSQCSRLTLKLISHPPSGSRMRR